MFQSLRLSLLLLLMAQKDMFVAEAGFIGHSTTAEDMPRDVLEAKMGSKWLSTNSSSNGIKAASAEAYGTRDITTCEWKVELNMDSHFPLILDSNNKIVLPEMKGDQRVICIPIGKTYTIACPGKKNKIKKVRSRKNKYKAIEVLCKGDDQLEENLGGKLRLHTTGDLDRCIKPLKASLRNLKTKCAVDNGMVYGIVFDFTEIDIDDDDDDDDDDEYDDDEFYSLIEVCFDKEYETTHWTDHILYGENYNARNTEYTDRDYKAGKKFKPDLEKIYRTKNQKLLIQDILELEIDKDIINGERKRYLEKGHLSPFSDFITEPQKDASNYYINIVPQWENVNHRNWGKIEKKVQDFAKETSINLRIISGGYGFQKLQKKAQEHVEIFLGEFEDKDKYKNTVPIPNILWKIVMNEKDKEAVVFVVHNNPFLEEKPDLLCKDVCDEIIWLKGFDHYERHELCHGYTYCCKLAENPQPSIYNGIPTMPKLGNFQLLDY